MGTDAEFAAMLAAVSAGRLDPVVDSVFPLADVRKAYERMQSGEGFGKIVVKVSAMSAPDADLPMLRHTRRDARVPRGEGRARSA